MNTGHPWLDGFIEGANSGASGFFDFFLPGTPFANYFDIDKCDKGYDLGKKIAFATIIAETMVLFKDVRPFLHGGSQWHIGLELKGGYNLIHVGNHIKFGVHIAFGYIKPFVANWHFYVYPVIRFWKP